MMGNTQTQNKYNKYEVASQNIAEHYAGYEQEEKRILEELKRAVAKNNATSPIRGDLDHECKELSKELVRVRLKTKALSNELEKRRMDLKEEEKRVAFAMQESNRQGLTHDAETLLGEELLRARANVKDFDAAFAKLQVKLKFVEKIDFPIETFKQAIEFDQRGDYEKALSLYREGLDQNMELDSIKDEIERRKSVELLEKYAKRADELHNHLQKQHRQKGAEG